MNNRFVTAVTGARAASLAAAAGLLLGLGASGAEAQRKGPAPTAAPARLAESPGTPDKVATKRGFSLFAQADAAATGLNMTGTFFMAQTNYGLCGDVGDLTFNGSYCQTVVTPAGTLYQKSFGAQFVAAVPRSEFRKIRQVYPDIAAAKGDGWSTQINLEEIQPGPRDFGPRDGTLGQLFAGISSTDVGDGSCRDQFTFRNNYVLEGVSLLARSDCPETWAAGGFDGPRPIPDSAYIRAFQANPNGFSFDFFRIPASERNNTRFLGNTSTYGEISDHYAEQVELFGKVTALGSGDPQIPGYPIGLNMRFEAYVVSLPTLASAQFVQMTVVNNSAEVYGTGIDYDSLYMGLSYSSMNSPNTGNLYWVPGGTAARDLPSYLVSVGDNASRMACNGAYQDATATGTCVANTTTTGAFRQGGTAVLMLKSPIGDMRNKLLSRPGAFFNPASPFADDTITYNHGHQCGYGGCAINTWGVSERSGFGMMSSIEPNVLDGRDVSQLAPATASWRIFRNQSHPVKEAKFTRFVPGGWDYNNDGIQDTLSYTTCSTNGCVKTFADTLPGKQINRYANAMSPMTAGPFKLKAGDTTSFIYAFVGGVDSTSLESIIDNAYRYYMQFNLSPEAAPLPPIASTEVGIASVQDALGGDPYVRLYFGPGPDDYTDPFLANFASQVASGTDFRTIRALNPTLADSITARSKQNFRELLVYRSCDGGATFDADGDCVGDEATLLNGIPVGPGYRPYSIVTADPATGDFGKVFTDVNVTAGRTYLYSVVTRTLGFSTSIIDIDPTDASAACTADTTAARSACRRISRILTVADSITSTLPTSGPSTARVYVPISVQAGTSAASFTTSTRTFVSPTDSTSRVAATVPVFVRFGQNVQPGRYRALFANKFIYRSTTNRATGATVTTVRVLDTLANARRGNETAAGGRNISDTTLNGTKPIVVGDSVGFTANRRVTGASTATTTDDSTIVTDTINKFGLVFISPTGEPLFISTDLRSEGVTPNAFIASVNNTGFVVRFDQGAAVTATTPASEFLVRANGDTTQRTILDAAAVQYREAESTRRNSAAGAFEVRYADDPYGPQAPFRLDFANPAATQAAVVASLNARTVADTSNTSARLQDKARAFQAGVTLVKADFPFVLYNSAFGSQLILAKIRQTGAALQGDGSYTQSILLGQNADTLRVTVPENKWIPGDVLVAFQVVQRDSTITGGTTILDNTTGLPIQVTDTTVAFGPFVLGCNTPRSTCNPVPLQTPGATGYLTLDQGDKLVVNFAQPFTIGSTLTLDIVAPTTTGNARLSDADLKNIRVVPNPYVFAGAYDQVDGGRNATSQVYFTGVPSSGTLRVYSVSGQFIQELRWTAADLNGTGDLPYNLRSREGTDLASGLYIFVINTNAGGSKQTARGKFVVIR